MYFRILSLVIPEGTRRYHERAGNGDSDCKDIAKCGGNGDPDCQNTARTIETFPHGPFRAETLESHMEGHDNVKVWLPMAARRQNLSLGHDIVQVCLSMAGEMLESHLEGHGTVTVCLSTASETLGSHDEVHDQML